MRSILRTLTPGETRDNTPLAILSVCGGVALATIMDAAMKWLSSEYPVHQIMVLRCLTAAPLLLMILGARAREVTLLHPQWPIIVLRGFIMTSAFISFLLGIATMPLADAVAIYFTMPLFVAALAGPFLGEKVPASRWAMIIVGFLGVLVMIRPGSGVLDPAALFPLYAALAYGMGQLLTRRLGLGIRPSVLAFHQNAIFMLVAVVLSLVFGLGGFATEAHPSLSFMMRGWSMPSPADLALMLGLGIFSGIAMVLFTQAYRLAEANLVAPYEYTGMFWATVLGLVLFGDVPDWATAVGAALVIGAGLTMLAAKRRAPG